MTKDRPRLNTADQDLMEHHLIIQTFIFEMFEYYLFMNITNINYYCRKKKIIKQTTSTTLQTTKKNKNYSKRVRPLWAGRYLYVDWGSLPASSVSLDPISGRP